MINVIVLALLFVTETSQEYFSLLLQCYQHCSLQAHHVYSTLKRRRNGCFHVVLTWNTRGVSVGFVLSLLQFTALNRIVQSLTAQTIFLNSSLVLIQLS